MKELVLVKSFTIFVHKTCPGDNLSQSFNFSQTETDPRIQVDEEFEGQPGSAGEGDNGRDQVSDN